MNKLENNGTLLNKSKTKKLDYQKNGKMFEVDIYELKQTRKEGNIAKTSFSRINNFKLVMSEKNLLNYLYSELYLEQMPS